MTCLTQHASEPDGQVLLHGHQRSLVSDSQPLVVLEDICKAGTVPLCQRAARTSGAQQGGIKLLAEPHLEKDRGWYGKTNRRQGSGLVSCQLR